MPRRATVRRHDAATPPQQVTAPAPAPTPPPLHPAPTPTGIAAYAIGLIASWPAEARDRGRLWSEWDAIIVDEQLAAAVA